MRTPTVKVIYEDKDVLVVNKPAGLMVHPDGKREGKTLVDWVLKKYPKTAGVGEPLTLNNGTVIDRPGIVHRLDRDTSGVLVIAKNQKAYAFLKRQFESRTIEKKYLAIVVGVPRMKEDSITMPIGRSASDFRKWSARGKRTGLLREARTDYQVLEVMDGFAFLEILPKTGRTHQIRVHLAAIGNPVAGDELYGQKNKWPKGVERQLLHAASLRFALPSGKIVTMEAKPPKDFEDTLASLRKKC